MTKMKHKLDNNQNDTRNKSNTKKVDGILFRLHQTPYISIFQMLLGHISQYEWRYKKELI